jgi:hypothetical protein
MKKADLKILERIFSLEIEGRLPAQFKSKHLARLQEEGMVEPMTRTFGRDALGLIQASGWALTELGRLTYCESCKDVPEP